MNLNLIVRGGLKYLTLCVHCDLGIQCNTDFTFTTLQTQKPKVIWAKCRSFPSEHYLEQHRHALWTPTIILPHGLGEGGSLYQLLCNCKGPFGPSATADILMVNGISSLYFMHIVLNEF